MPDSNKKILACLGPLWRTIFFRPLSIRETGRRPVQTRWLSKVASSELYNTRFHFWEEIAMLTIGRANLVCGPPPTSLPLDGCVSKAEPFRSAPLARHICLNGLIHRPQPPRLALVVHNRNCARAELCQQMPCFEDKPIKGKTDLNDRAPLDGRTSISSLPLTL